MSLPSSTPKLPKWFFLLSDLLLIAVAAFIAANAPRPLSLTAILAISGCVALGALVTAAALIADYIRKTEEAIDDRQRALEALSRTVATSAEQISIATGGLNEIATVAQKNLQQAEQLPAKLQEKIAGFTRQLETVRAAETEKLQQEITTLRASATAERTALQQELAAARRAEADKLAAAGTSLNQAAAEFAKLEAATARHLAAARTATEAALAASLAQFETKLATLTRTLDEKLAALQSAAASAGPLETMPEAVTIAPFGLTAAPAPAPAPVEEPPAASTAPAETPAAVAEPAPIETPTPAAPSPEPETISTPDNAETSADPEAKAPRKPRAPRKPKPAEPAPELSLAEESAASPAAPAPTDTPTSAPALPLDDTPSTPVAPAPEPEVIEAPATPATSTTDEFTQLSPEEVAPVESITSDSTTRLLVTAYIGIGNRLFVRGDGPGLSWDKGVPLQFVSIGKWRWESPDVTAPVRAKLFKNDEVECTALGELRLTPGRQSEVTARF